MFASELKARFISDQYIQNRDDIALQATIDGVVIESNGYIGIIDETTRKQAIALHAAHCTRLELIAESSIGAYGLPVSIKSKDDEIKYGTVDRKFDFSTTIYGRRLQNLLDSQYAGGFLV